MRHLGRIEAHRLITIGKLACHHPPTGRGHPWRESLTIPAPASRPLR